MNEATVKTLKTVGKVTLWVIIPGGLALAGWALYKHYYPSAADGATKKPAPDKYQNVKPGDNKNPTGLTQP